MRTKENMHKSVYYTNKRVRKSIDTQLHKMSKVVSENVGLSMTKEDREVIKAIKNQCLARIKELDPEFWETIIENEDPS